MMSERKASAENMLFSTQHPEAVSELDKLAAAYFSASDVGACESPAATIPIPDASRLSPAVTAYRQLPNERQNLTHRAHHPISEPVPNREVGALMRSALFGTLRAQ
jgi:hypothetical protein